MKKILLATPIYKRVPTPANFKTTLEKQKYWAEEKRRWIEGYGSLPGTYYHFLQEQVVKDRLTGKTERPLILERDYVLHCEVNQAWKKFQPVFIVKARGTALSTFGGSLVNYTMRAYPGSTSLVTSADQPRIAKLYYDKIKTIHQEYHPDIQYSYGKVNETAQKIYVQLNVPYLDGDKTKVAVSDIYCNQTGSSDEAASAFSGTGAMFGFYDEIALNKRRTLLLQSSESCFINPNTSEREGLLVMGGTIEHTLTAEELGHVKTLYEKCVNMGYKVVFMPFWYRFHDKDGFIDKDAAERWYEQQYNEKSKSDDESDLIAFLKNNPRDIKDIFAMGVSGYFNERAEANLRHIRDTIILNSKDVPHRLQANENGKVEIFPDKKGAYLIHEHPKHNVKYYMTIDGVATGTQYGAGNKGSKVAAIIWKMFDPDTNRPFETVATMAFRPQSLEQTFPYLLDFAKYYDKYNGFMYMHPEASNSTHELLPQYMINEGFIHWVKKRVDYSKHGNIDTKKYGQPMNQHSIPYAVGRWNQLLEKYPHCITMLNVIDDMLLPVDENADIRSAALLFAFLIDRDFDKPPEPPKQRYKMIPEIAKMGGKSVFRWNKILIEETQK